MSLLLNPGQYQKNHPDQKTTEIMQKTIQYFEEKGLGSLREEDRLHK